MQHKLIIHSLSINNSFTFNTPSLATSKPQREFDWSQLWLGFLQKSLKDGTGSDINQPLNTSSLKTDNFSFELLLELGCCLWMQVSGTAPGATRRLIRRFGFAGFFVCLAIGASFAATFIGEYLDRSDQQKGFWKAGITVSWRIRTFHLLNSNSSSSRT